MSKNKFLNTYKAGVNIRILPEERDIINSKARAEGLSLTHWIRKQCGLSWNEKGLGSFRRISQLEETLRLIAADPVNAQALATKVLEARTRTKDSDGAA